jgi:N-acetyl-gamma-glutamylphosphate reductase
MGRQRPSYGRPRRRSLVRLPARCSCQQRLSQYAVRTYRANARQDSRCGDSREPRVLPDRDSHRHRPAAHRRVDSARCYDKRDRCQWRNEHRHLAEMRAVAAQLGGKDNDILFTPHLLPVARGILATITVPVKQHVEDPSALWRQAYNGEPFIEIADQPPSLRDVVRRNVVRLSVAKAANVRQPTLIIISAIDNLMKGAAGQALQNANVLLGLSEQAGLPA